MFSRSAVSGLGCLDGRWGCVSVTPRVTASHGTVYPQIVGLSARRSPLLTVSFPFMVQVQLTPNQPSILRTTVTQLSPTWGAIILFYPKSCLCLTSGTVSNYKHAKPQASCPHL